MLWKAENYMKILFDIRTIDYVSIFNKFYDIETADENYKRAVW